MLSSWLFLDKNNATNSVCCAAVVRFFDTAQGKAQGHLVQHSSDIVAISLNQQGIAPDRQVIPVHLKQPCLPNASWI